VWKERLGWDTWHIGFRVYSLCHQTLKLLLSLSVCGFVLWICVLLLAPEESQQSAAERIGKTYITHVINPSVAIKPPPQKMLLAFEDDQQLWPSNLLLKTSFKMINSYGLQSCCWKPLWRWSTAMAFKSAAENLFEDDQQLWPSNLLLKTFEDDQQLWPSNLLLKTFKVMNRYGLQICCWKPLKWWTAMAFKSAAAATAAVLLQHYLEIKWWRRSSIPQNVQCTSLTVLFASVCFKRREKKQI